jgi:hypothetical protein
MLAYTNHGKTMSEKRNSGRKSTLASFGIHYITSVLNTHRKLYLYF